MGKPHGKTGKNARRSRQARLGLTRTTDTSKAFKKAKDNREEKKDKKKDLELIGEEIREKLGTGDNVKEKKPHSFVFHMGKIGKYVRRLERDIRRILLPHTSIDLRVTKRNVFKDFLVHSQYLGVSHLALLSRSDNHLNLRFIKNPQGPTIHFKIETFALRRDVLKTQKRPVYYDELFLNSPLVIMNGFAQTEEKHWSLVQDMLQNMFPTIDVDQIKLKTVRRALLINYNAEENVVEMRHYSIKAAPAGISKPTKKLMQSKVPDLSKYKDFSQFLLKPEALSDSEYEEEQEVELPQTINSRGLSKGQQTKIRLTEIGPRLTLKLIKIEEGVNGGNVLYHSYIKKPETKTEKKERLRKNRSK